jgi:hypothetical protein
MSLKLTREELGLELLAEIQRILRRPEPVPPGVFLGPVYIMFHRAGTRGEDFVIGIFYEPKADDNRFIRGRVDIDRPKKRKD